MRARTNKKAHAEKMLQQAVAEKDRRRPVASCRTTACHGVVWRGVAWHGMAWYVGAEYGKRAKTSSTCSCRGAARAEDEQGSRVNELEARLFVSALK